MPGICRVGIDTAGGVIIGVVQDGTVFANGALVSVDNLAIIVSPPFININKKLSRYNDKHTIN
jgi:hypothetical protein